MPTYEYRCPNGHDFEKFYRSISTAATEVSCPTCGVIAARQMSAGAGLMFKGSGFYLTDYGKNAHGKKDPSAKPVGEGGGDGGAKSDGAASSDAKGGDTARSGESGTSAKGGEAKPEKAATAEKPSSSKPPSGSSGTQSKSE